MQILAPNSMVDPTSRTSIENNNNNNSNELSQANSVISIDYPAEQITSTIGEKMFYLQRAMDQGAWRFSFDARLSWLTENHLDNIDGYRINNWCYFLLLLLLTHQNNSSGAQKTTNSV